MDGYAGRIGARVCTYADFKRCQPPSFDGTKDALAAHQWVREMEAVLRISNCRKDDMVVFAAHSFLAEALCWWNNLTQALGDRAVKRMRWEELKQLFLEQYCPEYEISKLEKEFLTLEAGNMTHKEYTTKYNEMALLFPDLITPEEKRIKRYVQGLPVDIRRGVMTTKMSTFRSVVALSGALYEQRDVVGSSKPENGDGKRFKHENSGSSVKKAKIEARDTRGSSSGGTACEKCGKSHSGNCVSGDYTCFRCGKAGHPQHECPTLTCYRCGGPGHLASRCTAGGVGGSNADKSKA